MKVNQLNNSWVLTVIISLFNFMYCSDEIRAESNITIKKVNPIQIEITTHLGNQQSFVDGDIISFLLNLDTDAYLLVVYQDATGNLIQLLPNRDSQKERYRAGLFISLPEEQAPFRFKVQPPYGDEILWAFASDEPQPNLKGEELQNGLKRLKLDFKTLLQTLRNKNQKSYGESSLSIHTRAR